MEGGKADSQSATLQRFYTLLSHWENCNFAAYLSIGGLSSDSLIFFGPSTRKKKVTGLLEFKLV